MKKYFAAQSRKGDRKSKGFASSAHYYAWKSPVCSPLFFEREKVQVWWPWM